MAQITSQRKNNNNEVKEIRRDRYHKDYFWVQSEKYDQLSYRVILSNTEMYCACEYFKHKQAACKHIMKVMAREGGHTV
jgi:hypothetical protein